MQQFFIDDINTIVLSKEQTNQCLKVLRMKKGDVFRIVDRIGNGAIVVAEDDEMTNFRVVEMIQWPIKRKKLRIIASLIRSERLEWMIQKACECGVDEIVLYQSDHGVVRDFGKRADRKLERFNLIAKEASEQSYRQFSIPVNGPIGRNQIENFKSDYNFYADIGNAPHLITELDSGSGWITLIIGPEGGFSDQERIDFRRMSFSEVSLGDNVLRAETASIFACNVVAIQEVLND